MIKKLLPIIILLIFFIGCSSKQSMITNKETVQKDIYTTSNTNSSVQKSGQDSIMDQNESGTIGWSPNHTKIIIEDGSSSVFINSSEGWKADYMYIGMFNEEMVLYKTADGGKTWIKVSDSKASKGLPSKAHSGFIFINSNIGWTTTQIPQSGYIGLFKTIDGGKTWNFEKLNIPIKFKEDMFMTDPPVFFSASDGILITNPVNSTELVFITHDGGETWTPFESGSDNNILHWKLEVSNNDYRRCVVTYKNEKWISHNYNRMWDLLK